MSFNFPLGSYNESLKHVYQQYLKSDAEARDSSRQLLTKLQKFEFKAMELGARSHMARQMRSRYEKMLIQQSPLLWAQIQRALMSDELELEYHAPMTNSTPKSAHRGTSTRIEDNSSTSDDSHSLNEEGAWPHTPSPYPDVETSPAAVPTKPAPAATASSPKIAATKVHTQECISENYLTVPKSSVLAGMSDLKLDSSGKSEETGLNLKLAKAEHAVISHLNLNASSQTEEEAGFNVQLKSEQEMTADGPKTLASENIVPPESPLQCEISTRNNRLNLQEQLRETSNPTPKSTQEETPSSISAVIFEAQVKSKDVSSPKSSEKMTTELKLTESQLKPFRLNSDSESIDCPVSVQISGPNHASEDEDDSFWN